MLAGTMTSRGVLRDLVRRPIMLPTNVLLLQ